MKHIKPRWIVIGIVVLALAAGVGRAMLHKRQQQAAASAPATTITQIEISDNDVMRAELRDITQTLALSGTVKAVNYAVIKARVAGELKDVVAREGDVVKAGDVLARIDPTEYQRRWQQANEQASASKSQWEIAQRTWDNNKGLVEQGFISKTAMDNSRASYEGALASYKAALAGAEVAHKALDDATLRAPFAGVVAARSAQMGERVAIDTKIMELVDVRQLEVEGPLSASEAINVSVGQVATLQIENGTASVGAKVTRISPSAQPGSRSVLIYLSLDKAEGLRHGLFVTGVLKLGKSHVLAVPLSTVRTDRPQPYVQVVEPVKDTSTPSAQEAAPLQVTYKPVTLGIRGLDQTQPESETWVGVTGLAAGATVLKNHVGLLREGMRVTYTQRDTSSSASSNSSSAPSGD